MTKFLFAAAIAAALMIPSLGQAQTAGSQAKGEPQNAAVKQTSQDPNMKDAKSKKSKKMTKAKKSSKSTSGTKS